MKLTEDQKRAILIAAGVIALVILIWLLFRSGSRGGQGIVNAASGTPEPNFGFNLGSIPATNRPRVGGTTVNINRQQAPASSGCGCSRESFCGCSGSSVLMPSQQALVDKLNAQTGDFATAFQQQILSVAPDFITALVNDPLSGIDENPTLQF